MESLLARYGLPEGAFRTLLQECNGCLIGSGPLAVYLALQGLPSFSPRDLEVWLPEAQISTVTAFLIQHGHHLVSVYVPPCIHRTQPIVVVETLEFDSLRIRLTGLLCTEAWNYLFDTCDWSVRLTWWNTETGDCETLWPEELLRMEMHFRLPRAPTAQERTRRHYYEALGFRLAHPLRGVSAFDLIAYEEVDAATFLCEDTDHRLLCMGDQLYAVRCTEMLAYLEEHGTPHPTMGVLYSLPTKQFLSEFHKEAFRRESGPIFELVFDSMLTEPSALSVYRVRAYGVEEWCARPCKKI